MNIDKVIIKAFGSHLATEVPFQKSNAIIVGDLNSGKSTVLQAIEFALTGQCDRFRKKTADFSQLAHSGKLKFEVELWTSFGVVKRGRNSDSQYLFWNQAAGSPAEVESSMFRDLNTTKDQLSAVMAGDFLDLTADEQRELILRLMGVQVDMDVIKKMFVDEGAGDQAAFDYFKNELYPGTITSIQHFNQAFDVCFKERTKVNRSLKEARPVAMPEGKKPDVDAIKKKLEAYEIAVKDEIANAARLKAMDRSVEFEMITKEAKQLETWFNANSMPKPDEIKALVDRQIDLANKHEKSKAALATYQREDIEAETALRVHTQNVALLEKFDGKCVAGSHACPAEVSVMRQAAKEANVGLRTAKETREQVAKKLKTAKDAVADDFILEDVKKRLEGVRRREELFAVKKKEQDALQKRLEAARAASYDTEQGKKIGEAEAKIKDLEGKIKYGRGVLEKAHEWVAQEKLHAGYESGRVQLEVTSRHLEALVAFFGPNGSKKQLVESKVSGFQEKINMFLEPLGFRIKFNTDPWHVDMVPDPLERPVDRSSRSERWRLSVAIQLAIAQFTGLDFVVIDNAELLTPEVRFSLLKTLKASGVQSIMALTLMKPLDEFSPPKDAAFEWFGVRNSGGVSTVEKLAAK